MGITIFSAALLAGVAFCASGLGYLLAGCSSIENPRRALAAEYLIGFLAYSVLFGLAVHSRLTFSVAASLGMVLAVVGIVGCVRSARIGYAQTGVSGCLRNIGCRLLLAGAAGVSLLSLWPVHAYPPAADPRHYAYAAATMFHDGWVRRVVLPPDLYARLLEVKELVSQTRAPAVAMLWPPAALGWGVDATMVTQLAAWLLVVASVLLVDTLSGFAPLSVRVVLATAGVGIFNVTSILQGGQVNQAVSLAAVLTAVWVCRFTGALRARLVTLALVGNLLAAAYPEFLLAVPLYLGCILVLRSTSWQRATSDSLAIFLGVLVAEVTAGFGHSYLKGQHLSAPSWLPLARTPTDLGELWTAILFQSPPRPWLLVVLLALLGLSTRWWTVRRVPFVPGRAAVWLVVVGLVLVGGVWSWAVLRAGNVNYATFKLSGWLGPGLLLLCWMLVQPARTTVRRVLGALVLTLAATRCLALAGELPALMSSSAWHPIWVMESTPLGDRPCVVSAASERKDVVLRAIAESGAAARGCAIAISRSSALASIYKARPPQDWRSKQRKTYVVGIENAGVHTWETNGPANVELGVRFAAPGVKEGPWASFALPGPVPPGMRTKIPVEISAPAEGGQYVLEHRLMQARTAWSEQMLRTDASVQSVTKVSAIAAISRDDVWVVADDGRVFRRQSLRWEPIPGALRSVAAGSDGTVWGVHGAGQIFRWDGRAWQEVGGVLTQVSVGSSRHIWGIDAAGVPLRWESDGWQPMSGRLKQVAVGADGVVWGVNRDDSIFTWSSERWQPVSGLLRQISASRKDHVWGVNRSDQVFRWDGTTWRPVAGEVRQIATAFDGSVWGVTAGGAIVALTDSGWTGIAAPTD